MAKSKTLECSSCDAMFAVKHQMDEKYYPVTFCPFCGDELDIEESLDFEYVEEEE